MEQCKRTFVPAVAKKELLNALLYLGKFFMDLRIRLYKSASNLKVIF